MKEKAKAINEMKIQLPAISVNEGMARASVAAFCAQLNPTIDELADIKCAVSEAVTNCIVHGYRERAGDIYIKIKLYGDRTVNIEVKDRGCGISDIKKARTPLYTTDNTGERSGMGFTVMESFCDSVKVTSKVGAGTSVILKKKLSERENMRYGM